MPAEPETSVCFSGVGMRHFSVTGAGWMGQEETGVREAEGRLLLDQLRTAGDLAEGPAGGVAGGRGGRAFRQTCSKHSARPGNGKAHISFC